MTKQESLVQGSSSEMSSSVPSPSGSEGSRVGHTKGPWELDEDGDVCDDAGMTIALVYSGGVQWPNNENYIKANAHLIAAAPDLLAALIGALPAIEDAVRAEQSFNDENEDGPEGISTQYADLLDEAKAAIAKAKGGAL